MKKQLTLVMASFILSFVVFAQKDTSFTTYKHLPLKATRMFELKTEEGTWTSIDVSPDGSTIVFDMMGDLYTIPFNGGKATQITRGLAFDQHPRFSPDGKKFSLFQTKAELKISGTLIPRRKIPFSLPKRPIKILFPQSGCLMAITLCIQRAAESISYT